MSKKKRIEWGGNFYSEDDEWEEDQDTLVPEEQDLRIGIEKNNRGGKTVTVVSGFVGQEEDLKELAKYLKVKCGVGGNAKNKNIIIQGDLREKIVNLLHEKGYRTKRIN